MLRMSLGSLAALLAVSVLAAAPIIGHAQVVASPRDSTAENVPPVADADTSSCDPKQQTCAAPEAAATPQPDTVSTVEPNGDAGNPKPMVPTCDSKNDPSCSP